MQVTKCLRVSTKSAYQWRRRWRADGPPRWLPTEAVETLEERSVEWLARTKGSTFGYTLHARLTQTGCSGQLGYPVP